LKGTEEDLIMNKETLLSLLEVMGDSEWASAARAAIAAQEEK
jgi:hypothetical protein